MTGRGRPARGAVVAGGARRAARAFAEVAALARLRWSMLRRRRQRLGAGAALLLAPALLVGMVWLGARAGPPDGDGRSVVAALAVAFLAVCVLAPLSAGGGHTMFGEDELVAFGLGPAGRVLASLALSPLNPAWTAHALALCAAAGYGAGFGLLGLAALAIVLAAIAAATAIGLAVSWLIVGARASSGGRVVLVVTLVVLGVAGVSAVGLQGAAGAPPRGPVPDLLAPQPAAWAAALALLVCTAGVATVVAAHACGWALGRAGQLGRAAPSRGRRRHRPARSVAGQLRSLDRAGVVRSVPLRRGLLVLLLLPGPTAAAAGVGWESIAILPAVLAAGVGLAFGANVFCLDGGGATWLASLPHRPVLAYRAKARVIAECCLVVAIPAVAIAGVAAGPPSATQACTVVAALVLGPATVVGACMSSSVLHPHCAPLRGPRDAPLPPGAMLVRTASLSALAAAVGIVVVVLGQDPHRPWLPLAGAALLTPVALARLWWGACHWADPVRRARVVEAVSAG